MTSLPDLKPFGPVVNPEPALDAPVGSFKALGLSEEDRPVVLRTLKIHDEFDLLLPVAVMTLGATDPDMFLDLENPELPRAPPEFEKPADRRLKLRAMAMAKQTPLGSRPVLMGRPKLSHLPRSLSARRLH